MPASKTLHLSERLTAQEAVAQMQVLLAQIVPGAVIRLDTSALRHFDSSALAVILACLRQASDVGADVHINGLPARAQSLAQVYGLAPLFQAHSVA